MRSLPPPTTIELIRLFEDSSSPINGLDGFSLAGIPAWELRRRLPGDEPDDLRRWLRVVGYAGVWETFVGDELEVVDLEEDSEDPEVLVYRCPESFRRRRISRTEAAVCQVDSRAFLNGTADLLDIPGSQRAGIDEALIDGALWKLGEARLDQGLHAPVYVARSLGRHLPELVNVMFAGRRTGLVLSSSRSIPELIDWPEGVVVASLADAVVSGLGETRLDRGWLGRLFMGGNGSRGDPDFPIEFDRSHKCLRIRGQDPWYIKGAKQAAVVEYMVRQARNGRGEIPAKELLAIANRGRTTGGVRRIASLFSGNPEWTRYIGNPSWGIYCLRWNPPVQ